MANTLRRPAPGSDPHPVHRPSLSRHNVICIYCYRTLGAATSAQRQEKLRQAHQCAEARIAKLPAAPPPYN